MKLLTDEKFVDEVFEHLVRKHTWTNNYMLQDEYRRHIQNRHLYSIQDDENVYFLILKNGFYRLYFFINQPEHLFTAVVDKPLVLELIYRGEKHFPTSVAEFWQQSGFSAHLTRDAYFLKNNALSVPEGNQAVSIQVAKSEEELQFVKKLMDQDLDLYTGDNLTLKEIREFAEKELIYVAYLQDELCGFLQADFKNSVFWLGHIVVDQAYRGKGIAKTLVNHYLCEGIKHECKQFQLWVLQDNEAAVNLYKNVGFTYLNKSTHSLLKNKMEKILAILSEVRPDIEFEQEDSLVDGGLLDSFDIVSIISELNDAFDINIRVHDLKPENFNSLAAIQSLVEKKVNEKL